MATTYGVRIDQEELNVKAIAILRKRLGLAMGEIRRRAAEGEPMYECDATDNNGIALVIEIHRELEKVGVSDHILRSFREVGAGHLENVLRERREDVIAEGEGYLFEDEPWLSLALE